MLLNGKNGLVDHVLAGLGSCLDRLHTGIAMNTLTMLLSTPLADLRAHWLEERCCGEPTLSPLWIHAARWPGWLLSDQALDHTCPHCGAMPALTMLVQDRLGLPVNHARIHIADRFDET